MASRLPKKHFILRAQGRTWKPTASDASGIFSSRALILLKQVFMFSLMLKKKKSQLLLFSPSQKNSFEEVVAFLHVTQWDICEPWIHPLLLHGVWGLWEEEKTVPSAPLRPGFLPSHHQAHRSQMHTGSLPSLRELGEGTHALPFQVQNVTQFVTWTEVSIVICWTPSGSSHLVLQITPRPHLHPQI